MAIEIDGAAVLRAVLDHVALFPEAAADLAKTARALVAKQIKAKSTQLADLQAIAQAIGAPALALIVDGLNDAEVRSLALRVGRGRDDVRTAEPQVLRAHLVSAASRHAEPAEPQHASGPAAEPAEAAAPSLRHESVKAKRKKRKKK